MTNPWCFLTLNSLEWRIAYPAAEVLALPAIGSDHSPLSLSLYPVPICPLCGLEPETIEHTFLLCPWITQLWTEPSLQVEVNRVGLTRFDEWLYKVHTSSRTSQEFELLANVLWCIWKDRNHHIFRKSPLNFHHTLFRAITSQDSFATWNPKLKNQKKEADLHNKWQPPKPGVLKINIDASFGPPSPQHLMSHGRKLKMTSSTCMETYNWLALLATQRPQPYRQQWLTRMFVNGWW